MIVSDLQIKVINKAWYLVNGDERHGPYEKPEQAIKARQELARIDVSATAAKVGRKQQRERTRERW